MQDYSTTVQYLEIFQSAQTLIPGNVSKFTLGKNVLFINDASFDPRNVGKNTSMGYLKTFETYQGQFDTNSVYPVFKNFKTSFF